MIRILHLINELETGGAETLLVRLLERMDPGAFQNEVVSLSGRGNLGPRIAALGIPVTALQMRANLLKLGALVRLVSKVRQFRPHIVQSWLYHADLMGLSVAKATQVPALVWCVHGCDLNLKECSLLFRMMLWVLARTSRFVDTVIPVSQGSLRWHQELGYRPKRWELVRVGVDTVCFQPQADARTALRSTLGLDPGAIVIGVVARFHPMKGHENFLRAMALLCRQIPNSDLHAVMLGSRVTPENDTLTSLISQLELDGRIHLLGERADVNVIMAGLDILCSSSHVESCPTVVLEAMACGVPCAVTDVGDSAFLVGSTGQLAPAGNPQALAQALQKLAAIEPARRERLGQQARRRVIEQFSLEVLVDKYSNLYRSLCERPNESVA
jgi:glycosyltransferase involved in cell wall biosynthesis